MNRVPMIALRASGFDEPFVIRLTALILVFILTFPALLSILKRVFSSRKRIKSRYSLDCYEDEDGVATEQAQKAYSVKVYECTALGFVSIGLIVSIILNVYSEIQPVVVSRWEDWFTFGSWVS